ncbi:NAD(P)-binding protein [Iodidimonas sp. SYSU 1G8]|uniref:NAD(P)/FAD-dependent oxidoreductase n=1 Tax=Iodidimonas sp. SYSU 1G8 TaxID=3133967 RepID=UPI0031FED459
MRIAIIGAGMAGLACGVQLQATGAAVSLFDKGRGPGGRMSTRRIAASLGEAGFDHGAPFFEASDPAFAAQVNDWIALGCAASWPAAGESAFIGAPSMNAPLKLMACDLDVRWATRIDTLSRRDDGWHIGGAGVYDSVVVAVPAEQAAILLATAEPAIATRAARTPSAPCWSVMAAFAEPLEVATDLIRHDGIVATAVRNSAKPGRSGPESWVIQASAEWSRLHIEDEAGSVATALLEAFRVIAAAALPAPVILEAHRWRYAQPLSADGDFLWNGADRIGACGDWLGGGDVQGAWLSGRALAARILAHEAVSA